MNTIQTPQTRPRLETLACVNERRESYGQAGRNNLTIRKIYGKDRMQTGGIDPVTGDCSMSANGLWIEHGRIVGPVGGVTIAATLDGFLNNITAVGSDLRIVPAFGAIGVPTLRVDNGTIGGT